MSVKQIIAAECDAIKCRFEQQEGGRAVENNDHVYAYEDTIFHASCFDQMTPHEALQHFRISLKAGEFRPAAAIPTGPDGLPDITSFISPAHPNGVTSPN